MSVNDEESYCVGTSSSNCKSQTTKTKIVIHINNYIFEKSEEENTSNDLGAQLRSLASPDSFFINDNGAHYSTHYGSQFNLQRYKKSSQPKESEAYILHAKNLKFPCKIRPAYEIYPSSGVIDKFDKSDWTAKNYNNKFDINFQLPFINPSHQASFQNYQSRHMQNLKPTSKVLLPNYLSTQSNMKPPSFMNRNSRSNPILTYKKIVKLREANALIENLQDAKKNSQKTLLELKNSKNSLITYGQNFEKDQTDGFTIFSATDETEKRINENAHSQKNFRSIHRKKDSSLIKPINYSFKLPPFLSSKYATTNRTYQEFSVNLINQEISTKNLDEANRATELSKEMDKEINSIVRNYPSIIVRRKAVKKF